jgi:hypothetical protein
MPTDFVIDQFARNIIRSGLCNITLNAEIEYKRNIDLFYSLNVIKSVQCTILLTSLRH